MNKQERLKAANEFIQAIGDCGRRFFWSATNARYARMEFDARGRLWWIDDYSEKRIYMHTSDCARWRGFTHGGTLKSLAKAMRDFVMRGETLSATYFTPREWIGGGHPWGYGDDILKVRDSGLRLGILRQSEEVPA